MSITLQLDPRKWFGSKPVTAQDLEAFSRGVSQAYIPPHSTSFTQEHIMSAVFVAAPTTHVSFLSKAESFLSKAGSFFKNDVAKGVTWAAQYAPPVTSVIALLIPQLSVTLKGVSAGITLLQNTIISIEQKFAAAGVQNGTGTQKLAEVLTIAAQPVMDLFAKEGITVDQGFVSSLVTLIVTILNVHPLPEAAA